MSPGAILHAATCDTKFAQCWIYKTAHKPKGWQNCIGHARLCKQTINCGLKNYHLGHAGLWWKSQMGRQKWVLGLKFFTHRRTFTQVISCVRKNGAKNRVTHARELDFSSLSFNWDRNCHGSAIATATIKQILIFYENAEHLETIDCRNSVESNLALNCNKCKTMHSPVGGAWVKYGR